MTNRHDPVDNALEALGGRSWPGDFDNNKLKDRIMQDFQTKRTNSRFAGRGALVAMLAIGLLGATGFAAAGGLTMVQTWFISAEVNGEAVEIDDADVTVVTDGNSATITVDGLEGDFEEGDEITITATSDVDGSVTQGGMVRTIEISPAEQPSESDD